MCPWLGLGFTRTRTLTLTARRQGRAQSAPAARKKKQPVRHARSTETGIVSPTSRLHLAYSSPTSRLYLACISPVSPQAAYPTLGVIWVDAHADANTPDTSPSMHYHGMP